MRVLLECEVLYTSLTRDRFFLIPGNAELPGGTFHIHTTNGGCRSVDEAALDLFEIPREQALPLLQAEMRGALGRLFQGLAEADDEPAPVHNRFDPDALLRDLLGVGLADLARRPEALVPPLLAALPALETILASASDPEARARANMQLGSLQETLSRHGFDAGKRITTLPDRLRSYARTPSGRQRLDEALARLHALLDEHSPRT